MHWKTLCAQVIRAGTEVCEKPDIPIPKNKAEHALSPL
jgi:hypothetical protein